MEEGDKEGELLEDDSAERSQSLGSDANKREEGEDEDEEEEEEADGRRGGDTAASSSRAPSADRGGRSEEAEGEDREAAADGEEGSGEGGTAGEREGGDIDEEGPRWEQEEQRVPLLSRSPQLTQPSHGVGCV